MFQIGSSEVFFLVIYDWVSHDDWKGSLEDAFSNDYRKHWMTEYEWSSLWLMMNGFFFSFLGCKIKALRAKTNTYIKTPVRGEEPVFVVTGRKEDVAKAKREILSAAEHFSLIRASRRPSLIGSLTGKTATVPGPPVIPGQVTIQVRVPYRVGEFFSFFSLIQAATL